MRTNLYYAVGQVALAYLCFWLAVRLPLDRFDRFGDFSYGLYIYAFPVEQILALYGVYRWGLAAYVLLSLAIALVVAMASWFLVEKPFLRLKRLQLGELPATGTPGVPPGWRRVWNPRLRLAGGTARAHTRAPRTSPYGAEQLTPPPVRRSPRPTMGPRVPGGPPARTPDQEVEAPW
jgi:peptidoglycan/LPS O-acetylase OafA/YrhL